MKGGLWSTFLPVEHIRKYPLWAAAVAVLKPRKILARKLFFYYIIRLAKMAV